MKKIFKKIKEKFEDALFVNFDCMFCNVETINESKLCPKCEAKLKFINGEVCEKCGAPVEKSDKVCYNCFDKNYNFNKHRSCIIYDELSSNPVRKLKYYKAKYLAEPIARFMFVVHKELIEDADYISFVPMSKTKREDRGYNHTEEIAKIVSNIANKPIINFLNKIDYTKSQAGLGFIDRTKNLKGSFGLIEENKDKIKGKKIILLDDVFTTGSTSFECTRMINKCKPKEVNVITFLKTDPNQDVESLPF